MMEGSGLPSSGNGLLHRSDAGGPRATHHRSHEGVLSVAVRYSRDHLIGLVEELSKDHLPAGEPDSWVGLGWSATRRWWRRYAGSTEWRSTWLTEHAPADAMRVEIHPFAGRAYGLNVADRAGGRFGVRATRVLSLENLLGNRSVPHDLTRGSRCGAAMDRAGAGAS